MIDNKLHLIPVLEKGQTYDAPLGSIVLQNAGYFAVTIKEYQEDEKKIKELEKKKETTKNYAIDKWEENEKKGLSQKKLKEEYEQDIQEYSKLEAEAKKYKEKYNDVNWCWQLVGKKIDRNNLSHNETFSKGIYQIENIGKQSVNFPEFLIGGGISWIEAFHENEGPLGQTPYGLFVQAYGKPEITRIEWTDIEHNPLPKKIGFNSKVILHIYTKALYGQDLKIKLTDKTLFSSENKVFSEVPVFQRQVNIRKLEKRDLGKKGVSGLLAKEGQKDVAEQEYYTQKIELEILIEEAWDMHNGNVLSLFPTIESLEAGTYFNGFEGISLDVVSYGKAITSVQQVSNKPVLIGMLETHVGNYSHCRYKALILTDYNNSSKEIYRETRESIDDLNLEIGILAFRNPKTYHIKTDEEASTDECGPNNKGIRIHNNILSCDTTKVNQEIKIVKVEPKNIELEVSLDYDKINLFDFFWLSDSKKNKLPHFPIKASTCGHEHVINITLYPDISWELNLFYNTTDPVWYGQTSPVYNMHGTTSKATRDQIDTKNVKTLADLKALVALREEENDKNKASKNAERKSTPSLNRHYGDGLSSFGLSVKVTWDQVKSQEFSWKIAEKYRELLGIVKGIYDLVDSISGAKDARNASQSLSPNLLPRRNLMSLSLLPPAISVGVGWKYFPSKTGVMGVELKGKIKCAPLIGGELKIDLLALADKIPLYGKLVTALDIATWLAEKIALNKLSIDYRIDLTFYANLAIEEAFIKYNNAEAKGKKLETDMLVSGTLGGKLEISTEIKVKVKKIINVEPEITFEAGIKGDCYFKITASPNANYDNMIDWTTKFSGLILTGYFKVSFKDKRSKDKAKTLEPIPIIPSYTGTPVSMIYGEGKVNKY